MAISGRAGKVCLVALGHGGFVMKLVGYNINPVPPRAESRFAAIGQDMKAGHTRMSRWGVWEGKHGTKSSFFDHLERACEFAIGQGEPHHLPGERMWDVFTVGAMSGRELPQGSIWSATYEQALVAALRMFDNPRLTSVRLDVRAHGE